MNTYSAPKSILNWRFIAGLLVGIGFLLIAYLFLRPNIFIALISLLIASEIAHAITPRENAILGGIIGVGFGIFLGIKNYYLAGNPDEAFMVGGLILVALAGGAFGGIVFGVFGFLLGKLMKKFREGKGFFF
jgi:hypothetical protein